MVYLRSAVVMVSGVEGMVVGETVAVELVAVGLVAVDRSCR